MKSLVVLSGGMDSATALSVTVRQLGKESVGTVTFNYGSKHNSMENAAAKTVASLYGVSNILVNLPFINEHFKSALLQNGEKIPEGHYAEDSMKKTVVPYRNAIMLSIAAGLASSHGANELVIGNHAGDHTVYPDCREEFMGPFSKALEAGDWNEVKIVRPFEQLKKSDIVEIGMKIGTPYGSTWSCYKGGKIACGVCGTCVERLEAFDHAGAHDPIEYSDRESYKIHLKVRA